MDLFEDLPEPGNGHLDSVSDTKLQTVHSTQHEHGGDELFGGLPSVKVDNRGEKRKFIHRDRETSGKRHSISYHRVTGYYAERKGERDEMQDRHVIVDNFTPEVKHLDSSISRLACYAVYDGHNGARASAYAAQHLHRNIAEKFPKGDISQVEKDIKKCFMECFKKTDDDFLKEATRRKPSWKDGTTAAVVLVIDDTLYISNLGDSKAILCRYNESCQKYTAISLTKDHNPTLYEERMRIQKAGGHVRDGRVMGILEVSRSLGDGPYKTHGVSCVPDVKRCQITDLDRFLVIACDGLWKRFSNQETVDFVNRILEDNAVEASETKTEADIKYETACNRLANESVRRLSADNVTVLLVAIDRK